MIVNPVFNGSWWFYPSPLDFFFMVILTLFIEILIIGIFCYLAKIEEKKIPVVLGGVVFANLISAIFGYIFLFNNFGGW